LDDQPARLIYWTQEARDDSQQLPESTQAKIEQLLNLVARFPKMFRVENEGNYAGLRRMPVDRWILFYGYLPEDQIVMVQFIVSAASYHD